MKSSNLSSKKPESCNNPKTSARRKCPGMTRTEQPFSLILPKDQVYETLSAEKENSLILPKDQVCETLSAEKENSLILPKDQVCETLSAEKENSLILPKDQVCETLSTEKENSLILPKDQGCETLSAEKKNSLILPKDQVCETLSVEKENNLILPKVCETLSAEKENKVERSYEVLGSGMILLKNYLSLSDQVEIVNKCEELGSGPAGFGQPGYRDGRKFQLQMMCLGRYWDPQTKYKKQGRKNDGFKVPPVPDSFVSLVETAIQDSQAFINSVDELPFMSPNLCRVNFYTTTGKLGLHQDLDESRDSVIKGLPVVSISIGDSAEFMYGDKKVDKADTVVLESGDILIFGGKSRDVFHGVKAIIPNSAPEALLKETMLQPGRLNLTFRRF